MALHLKTVSGSTGKMQFYCYCLEKKMSIENEINFLLAKSNHKTKLSYINIA